jgi:hypothetical protein
LVVACLETLRDVVDEIVIGADARVPATDLAWYAQIADRVLRFEFAGTNRHWSWLVRQARCDWVLVLDGDELPSAALVAALDELSSDRRARQFSLPIQWPWPSPDVRLSDEPWASDRRLRLLRNDAGISFASRRHALADANPPIIYLDTLPVYHLDLLLPDRARREAKVSRYEDEMFGLLTPEGELFSRTFYLPEEFGRSPSTLPIAPEDVEQIRRALAPGAVPPEALDPSALPAATQREVLWYAPRADLPDDAYQASLTLVRPLPRFVAGRRDHVVWVRISNDGTALWPGGAAREPLIRVGSAWQPVNGDPRQEVGRTFLSHELEPDGSVMLPVEVPAPPLRGPAELIIDLVHEHVRWFGCGLRRRVEVGPSVAERLGTLVQRHGPLLPPLAVMEERRSVGARDGLVPPERSSAALRDPRLANLVASRPVNDVTIEADTLERIVELVRARRPAAVVEFGSGTSTLVLASVLQETLPASDQGPRLLSFEQSGYWAQSTRRSLAEHGLDPIAAVVELPIRERSGQPPGYSLTDEATAWLRRLVPEMIVIDGPSVEPGASRLGTVDLIGPYLREDALLLVTDALCDAELSVTAAWAERDDFILHGIRPTSRGLLEGTLRSPRGRLRRLARHLRQRG